MALHGAALTAWKRKHPALVKRWGKSKTKRKTARHTPKRSKTMAKQKRKRSHGRRSGGARRRSRRGGGGGGLFSLGKTELMYAAAAAGGYAFLQSAASEDPAKYDWFTKLPVIGPVGRAATVALIAGVAYKAGVGRKYTKPLALGVGAVAFITLARRRFKMYDGTDGANALGGELAGELAGDDGEVLAGSVDLAGEFR